MPGRKRGTARTVTGAKTLSLLDLFPGHRKTDYLRKLKQRWLKESIRSLEEEIRKKERANESKELQSLFAKLQALAAERSALDGGRQKPSENVVQPRRENSQ
ncbi:MAG: hypothetical protein NTX17_07105 [Candidatus Eisenbacteria bacterium]|nr:hypothetical protein [Candidatus Eisenbacteria bacterium]